MSHKSLFQISLLLAIFISTIWYTAGTVYSGQSPLSEPDSLIYLQYAKNMAEGHPFEYVQGDAPSTGCTSYLYPVLLAGLYKLGCSGERLLTASFVLNSFFYLTFVLLVGLIARKLAPRFYPFALFASVLSGQTVYTFFGQTDMGILLTLTFFCFWAYLEEKRGWLLTGMILAGLTHPTAAAPVGGLLIAGLLRVWLSPGTVREKTAYKNSWPIWIGLSGIAAITCTLLFNRLLTGDFIFMSLRAKGLFKLYAPIDAFCLTAINLVKMLKGLLFGMDSSFRHLFFFPLLTGLAALGGLLLRPWNKPDQIRFDFFVLPSSTVLLILLATNNQQSVSYDRYMAWLLPLFFIYIATLLEQMRNYSPRHTAAAALGSLLIAFQLLSFLFFADLFLQACNKNAVTYRFSKEVLDHTEPGDRIITEGHSGQMWYLHDRGMMNPFGLFTAECAKGRHWLCYVETLKYHPDLQPSYWLIAPEMLIGDPAYRYFLGHRIASNTDVLKQDRFSLYAADWSALALTPPAAPAGRQLRDQLDIGYWVDEQRCRYRMKTRLRGVKIAPSVIQDENSKLVEVGQLIIGSETFTLSGIVPGQPLHVVLRTGRGAGALISRNRAISPQDYTFNSPIKLTVTIDGNPLDVELEINETGFTDAGFIIPAEQILSETPKITVTGDHLSYGYWFYQ